MSYCKTIRQKTLVGKTINIPIPHKFKEGFVVHGQVKIYKKLCVLCGFTDWVRPQDKEVSFLDPLSLY